MSKNNSPWALPFAILLLIGSVSVGTVVFVDATTTPAESYPEQPESLNETNVVEFVTAYERVYAQRELSHRYSSVQPVSYDARNRTIVEQTENGYVVYIEVSVRWDGKDVEGDRRYAVNYLVNASTVRRAEADATVYPGPDPRTNSTTLEG